VRVPLLFLALEVTSPFLEADPTLLATPPLCPRQTTRRT
jgi:hypothetical protein